MRHLLKNLVAGGDRVTVAAARAALEAGGSAIDGAVAGAFAAMVAEPTLTSAGGGGCLLACPKDGVPVVFDFFVDMPSGAPSANMDFGEVTLDFGPDTQSFFIGRAAAAVPGNVAGLLRAQERLGCLPRRDVLAPAISAAREGVKLSADQAEFFRVLRPILTHDEAGRALFAPEGRPLGEGDQFVMADFAIFLEALSDEGPELLYLGEVAHLIHDWARVGGLIQADDLANYRVHEREPLRAEFAGHTLLLNPPPATTGDRLRRALAHWETYGGEMADVLVALGPNSAVDGHGSTTHLSVLDAQGGAASVTTTNGEGCGHILPGCGFMLNNMLGELDLNPDGFHRHAPGARLPTMIGPTIALRDGSPVLVTGTGGSNRIPSALAQVLVNVLDRGLDLPAALAAPRLHLDDGLLHVEPEIDGERLRALRQRFKIREWPGLSLFFGGAHTVSAESAAGDARRGGRTEVF